MPAAQTDDCGWKEQALPPAYAGSKRSLLPLLGSPWRDPQGPEGAVRRERDYLSSRQATPGSSLPSRNSRLAPPPVEI